MTEKRKRAAGPGLGRLARRLTASLCSEDLVLEPDAAAQLESVRRWLRHRPLRAGRATTKAPSGGLRVLFEGPPGTAKALAASLRSDASGRALYRVDLSRVVSRYIGETEKNLSRVFEAAERRDWILFFDEADALFGKRSGVKDSHDRYANLQAGYLLDRLESYPGLVVLATTRRDNLDPAFTRRFNAVVAFSARGNAAQDDD